MVRPGTTRSCGCRRHAGRLAQILLNHGPHVVQAFQLSPLSAVEVEQAAERFWQRRQSFEGLCVHDFELRAVRPGYVASPRAAVGTAYPRMTVTVSLG